MAQRLTIKYDRPLTEAESRIDHVDGPRAALKRALCDAIDKVDDNGDDDYWERVRVHGFVVTTGAHAEALEVTW